MYSKVRVEENRFFKERIRTELEVSLILSGNVFKVDEFMKFCEKAEAWSIEEVAVVVQGANRLKTVKVSLDDIQGGIIYSGADITGYFSIEYIKEQIVILKAER